MPEEDTLILSLSPPQPRWNKCPFDGHFLSDTLLLSSLPLSSSKSKERVLVFCQEIRFTFFQDDEAAVVMT